jgi:hypothetical protein
VHGLRHAAAVGSAAITSMHLAGTRLTWTDFGKSQSATLS